MNIFVTSESPVLSAQALDDKRVVKMVLECAQMASTAVRLLWPSSSTSRQLNHLYKASHTGHPCNVFARHSLANFNWLAQHGLALANEYEHRYKKIHASLEIIQDAREWVLTNRKKEEGFLGWSDPDPSAPLFFSFNCSGFPVGPELSLFQAYQQCLINKWTNLDQTKPQWTNRQPPVWFDPA